MRNEREYYRAATVRERFPQTLLSTQSGLSGSV
jgi:hypothetical protein